MREKHGHLITGASVLLLAIGAMVIPAAAAGQYPSRPQSGEMTTSFHQYLVMDAEAKVPNVEFAYSVTAGGPLSYSLEGETFEISAGVSPELVTMAGVGTDTPFHIRYTPSDGTQNTENAEVKNYTAGEEKYAVKSGVLDFSNVGFAEPGIYRYLVTEEEQAAGSCIFTDTDRTRVVDVYVEDESTSDGIKLKIAGYVLHSNTNDNPSVTLGTQDREGTYNPSSVKSQGFTNYYDSAEIFIRTEVSGNQASRNKYFKCHVELENAVPGNVFTVDLSNADTVSGTNLSTSSGCAGQTNPTSIPAGPDGKASADIYLRHGQEACIQGVNRGVTYTVTEDPEDYLLTEAAIPGYRSPSNGTVDTSVFPQTGLDDPRSTDRKISFLNTRSGTIPTGADIPGGAVMTILGFTLAMLATIMRKRTKEV